MSVLVAICLAAATFALGVKIGNASRPADVLVPKTVEGVTEEMIDAGLEGLMGDMWTGNAGVLGLKSDRSTWRRDMRSALRAAFTKAS